LKAIGSNGQINNADGDPNDWFKVPKVAVHPTLGFLKELMRSSERSISQVVLRSPWNRY